MQKESRIEGLIEARDEAAGEPLGKASRLLARLDQMYFEGSINGSELVLRGEIYGLLSEKNHNIGLIEEKLSGGTAKRVMEIQEDIKLPWSARVQRLTKRRGNEISLLEKCAKNTWISESSDWKPEQDGEDRWVDFEAALGTIKEEGDIHSYV